MGKLELKPFDIRSLPKSCSIIVVGAPGSGKCFGKDTLIRMADKSTRTVQNIKVGDKVLGVNGEHKKVVGVTRGLAQLYKVKQWDRTTYRDRMNDLVPLQGYVVNEGHPLVLIHSSKLVDYSSFITMPVEKYFRLTQKERNQYYTLHIGAKGLRRLTFDVEKGEERGGYWGFELETKDKMFLLADGSIVHNTTFIEDVAYTLRYDIPVCKIYSGTEDSNSTYSKIFPKLNITQDFVPEQEKKCIMRQKRCKNLQKLGECTNGRALVIVDDCSSDKTIYKSKMFKEIFKNGSRHWNRVFILGLQYAIDVEPDIRAAAGYIVIFHTNSVIEKKKIWENLGGACGTYKEFCAIIDAMVGDGSDPLEKHTCLVIKNVNASPRREDNIFYYKADIHPPYKFGCKEIWDRDAERRDPKKGHNRV